ncbi:MAG: DUF169 domain-containing protein [Actinobacteria bacterium]|nr:DUF169 domain-containing protein [Actinomycetota bacterium]MCL6094308.1 DUF169 domain-containing protein [Actinomycetota bacterium]
MEVASTGVEASADVSRQLEELDAAIERYVRPDSYPVAVRMLKPGEQLPKGVRVPSESVGERWIICQSIGIARRYGWAVAVGREDVICPAAAVAFGFRPPVDAYLKGYIAVGMYCETDEAAANLEASTWRFETGIYDRLCVAPLASATFEPHVVVVYGNSAQVMRLVNAALYSTGGRIESTVGGRLDCAEIVIQTMQTDEPKVILPCNGDRVFGMAQDSEMAFSFPWHDHERISSGLKGTHAGGVRYPIPVAMRTTPTMPKRYQELFKMLEKEDLNSSR